VKERDAVRQNLAIVLNEDQDSQTIREACGRVYEHFGRGCVDLLYDSRWDNKKIPAHVEYKNLEALDEALGHHKGVIVLSAHVGNWEFGAMAMAAKDYPVTVIVHPNPNPKIHQIFVRRRQDRGVKVLLNSNCSRQSIRLLARNEVLGVAGDRLYGAQGISVSLFGRSVVIPRGPVHLSLLTGAPIVAASMLPRDGIPSGYRLSFEDPLYPPDASNPEKQKGFYQEAALMMERLIRANPTYWFAFENIL